MERHTIITGGAGFIGSHLVDKLLAEEVGPVTVIDNFDPFYPRASKEANIAAHRGNPAFRLVEGDLLEDAVLEQALGMHPAAVTTVVHLAAKTGVRPSINHALDYHRVNVTGTLKLLEKARAHRIAHFVLASSSSVYGEHPQVPWKESLRDLRPISPYAATKLAAEQFTQVYARLHGLHTTVLRFFTVYGPRQRPDLAIHAFFRKVHEGLPIQRFGDGTSCRDYTYVADIVNGMHAAMQRPLHHADGQGAFDIFNLGNSETVALRDLIAAIEQQCGRQAVIDALPEQPGDVPRTFADVAKAGAQFGYKPTTHLAEGLGHFARWYEEQRRRG
ncbi:MAG: GDP-mannose 4,6-dehydratase [Flavobacteriales bacterium]|nr:GDP-mannose 4,6-dehydratase [Flavobacteriales bacterium]